MGTVDGMRRRRSRQGIPRPRTLQFSLSEEEFAEVSEAAARSGLARGAFAAEAALATARGTQARVVVSRNPCWDHGGVTIVDPDGYRLVLTSRCWP